MKEFKPRQKDDNEGNEWKTCISGSIQGISSISSTIDFRNYTLQAVEGRRDDFLTFSYHFYGFLRPYCEFGQNWRSSRGLIRNSVKNTARGENLVRSKTPRKPKFCIWHFLPLSGVLRQDGRQRGSVKRNHQLHMSGSWPQGKWIIDGSQK
jgi:hypothetical protein